MKTKNIQDTTSLFLIKDVWKYLTGVEHASSIRADIFTKHNISRPIILTFQKNNLFHYNVKRHHRLNNITVHSLWHDLLGFELQENDKINLKAVQDELILQLSKSHAGCTYKIKHAEDRNIINSITFHNRNNTISEYKLNIDGSVFCKDEYINNQHNRTVYYNKYGEPSLSENLIYKNKKHIESEFFFLDNTYINLARKNNSYVGKLDDINNILILEYIKKIKDKLIYIFIDKNILCHKPALYIRKHYFGKNDKQIRLINIIHGTHYKGLLKDDIIQKHYSEVFKEGNIKTDAVVCLTNKQRQDIAFRYPDKSIYTIPHSLDASLAKEDDRPAQIKSNIVIYIARLEKTKNQKEAIDIFRMVLKSVPDAKLLLYGSGTEKDNIKIYIDSLKLSDSIELRGYIHDIREAYDLAKVSILTSRAEGFCISLLESIAYGCPAIAYDINYGPSEIIKNNINGFIIQNHDKEAFASKIIATLTDNSLYLKLKSGAIDRFRNNFTHDLISKKWKKLLLDIADNDRLAINKLDTTYNERYESSKHLATLLSDKLRNTKHISYKVWVFKSYITVIDIYNEQLKLAIDVKFLNKRAAIFLFGRDEVSNSKLEKIYTHIPYNTNKINNKYELDIIYYDDVNTILEYLLSFLTKLEIYLQ